MCCAEELRQTLRQTAEGLQQERRQGEEELLLDGHGGANDGASEVDGVRAMGAPLDPPLNPPAAEAGGAQLDVGRPDARSDLHAGVRWLEEALPFLLLLAFVYIQNHLSSIVFIGWLVFMLHSANRRIRMQIALKVPQPHKLLILGALISSQIALIALIEGAPRGECERPCAVESESRSTGIESYPYSRHGAQGPHTHVGV